MPVLIPLIGAILVEAGVGATAAAIATAVVGFGVSEIQKSNAKKKAESDKQASVATMQVGEHPRRALFGKALTGGDLLYAFNDGTKNAYETLIIKICDHWTSPDALRNFYVGDEAFPFTDNGAQAAFHIGGQDHLWIWFQNGEDGQEPPSEIVAASVTAEHPEGRWSVNHRATGCTVIYVRYKANPKVWPAGRPGAFRFDVQHIKFYDPRHDSSVPGGSGLQRIDDRTTWEDTENPIPYSYAYRRGIYNNGNLILGRGLSAIQAPGEDTFEDANICDEVVDTLDGSERRWRFWGMVSADEAYIDVLSRFAQSCGGFIGQAKGRLAIKAGAARSPVISFTDDDLVPGEPIQIMPFRSKADRVNTVTATFTDPNQYYNPTSAPTRRDIADVVADGRPYEVTLQLTDVLVTTQAQRIAEQTRRLGRLERGFVLPLPPRFANAEVGDVAQYTSARYLQGGSVQFLIEADDHAVSQRKTFRLSETSAEAFGWDPGDDEIADTTAPLVPQTPPDEIPYVITSGNLPAAIVAASPSTIGTLDESAPVTVTGAAWITIQSADKTLEDGYVNFNPSSIYSDAASAAGTGVNGQVCNWQITVESDSDGPAVLFSGVLQFERDAFDAWTVVDNGSGAEFDVPDAFSPKMGMSGDLTFKLQVQRVSGLGSVSGITGALTGEWRP